MANYAEDLKEGDGVGQWFTCNQGMIGIIAGDGLQPYICFYPPKIESGVLPHAIYVKDGDMQIQVPQGSGKVKTLSVNKILERLADADACECECDCPVEAPNPSGS